MGAERLRRLPGAAALNVVVTELSDATAAQSVRWGGIVQVRVSEAVPAARIAAVARHVLADHVGRGGYCHAATCDAARHWLAPELLTAVNA